VTDSRPYDIRVPLDTAFDATIGFVVDPMEEVGRCSGRLSVAPKVCQPMGIVHGGVYAAIAETLASQGTAWGVMGAGMVPLGMSNNTSFLRPVSEGTVSGEAVAIHRGRTTWVWDVQMRNDEGKLCATSRVTIAVRERGPR
jgi:uncharacterized protein (TIGR00369 family)